MNQKSNRHFAITGGIGSGKSFVCQQLEARGIRVYDCDQAAKRLMRTDEKLQHNLCQLVGEELYKDHVLQKTFSVQAMNGWSLPSSLKAVSTSGWFSTPLSASWLQELHDCSASCSVTASARNEPPNG